MIDQHVELARICAAAASANEMRQRVVRDDRGGGRRSVFGALEILGVELFHARRPACTINFSLA